MLVCRNQKGEHFFSAFFRWLWKKQERVNTEKALSWLEKVGLDCNCAAMKAGELSYGQQKLLSLACCLINEGSIVFLDEPFAGVHPKIKMTISDIIRSLKKSGKLVVFIEHDLDVVRKLAEEVIVMDSGRIIARGDTIDVLNRANVLEAYVG